MPTQLQLRRGTTSQNNSFTGAAGELTIDLTNDTIRVHDGSTAGGKRLVDYDCKVSYEKGSILKPRKIKEPDDIRPGSKKGKLDRHPIWVVKITMPKDLILNIYSGYREQLDFVKEPATASTQPAVEDVPQEAEQAAEGGAV